MADIKISELTQVSALNNGDLVEVSQVNALAPSGYTSLKASMTDLGKKVNSDIDYTTELADFTDKTITGAIKETAKGKNVADEYDGIQTYDKGDVVIYKNTLYICTTNNTTGAWDATKWTATTVQSLIGDLSQLTTTEKSSLVGAVNEVNGNKPTNTAGSPFLKVKTTANITKSINANGYASILGSDIDLAEAGYTPIGIVSMYNTQSAGCFFGSFDCSVVSGSATFAIVKNTSTSNINATMNFKILFMRTTN